MKTRLKVSNSIAISILFLAGIATPFAFNKIRTTEDRSKASGDNSLRYFGYYWPQMSNIPSYSNKANVLIVGDDVEDPIQLAKNHASKLKHFDSYGIKGILDLGNLAYTMNGNKMILRADYIDRVNKYWDAIAPSLPFIAAFYPLDEPDGHVDNKEYAIVTKLLKSKIASSSYNIPILMVLSPNGAVRVTRDTYKIPDEVDWVGFDEYECWDNLTDDTCHFNQTYAEKFNKLAALIKPRGKNMVILGDAHVSTSNSVNNVTDEIQQAHIALNQKYLALCKAENSCIAMLVFLGTSNHSINGLDRMPILRQNLDEIGSSVIASATRRPTNYASPETLRSSVSSVFWYGDNLVIKGKNLGNIRGTVYVTINQDTKSYRKPRTVLNEDMHTIYISKTEIPWLNLENPYKVDIENFQTTPIEPRPTLLGSISQTNVYVGDEFELRCDYGKVVNCVRPSFHDGTCTFSGFDGTVAKFTCTAAKQNSNSIISCITVIGTTSDCPSHSMPVGSINIQ